MKNIIPSKTLLLIVLLGVTLITQAHVNQACYASCPTTPTHQSPAAFFDTPAFEKTENCQTLKSFCHWVDSTQAQKNKISIVADYDGTEVSEELKVIASESYIAGYPRSENSIVFGVVVPILKKLGYDSGMQTGDASNEEAAKYLAARNDSCEGPTKNPQTKFDYCISGRMVGMTTKQVQALHEIAYRIFPELNTYFSTTQAMLNYLAALGYSQWTTTGGTPYPSIIKADFNPQEFNQSLRTADCDITKTSTDMMNQKCPIIYDAPKISHHEITLIANTENVCANTSYANAQKTGHPLSCVNAREGKVSGLQTIEKRSETSVLNFQGNSKSDIDAGLYVAQKGGIVFMHNSPKSCKLINKKFPNSCFNIVDNKSETEKTLRSPSDAVYIKAAEKAGFTKSSASSSS